MIVASVFRCHFILALILFVGLEFVLSPTSLQGQSCGMHLAEQSDYVPASHLHFTKASRSGMRTILLKAFIVRNNAGVEAPGLSYPALVEAVEEANIYFSAFDLRFEVACEPTYLDDALLQYPGDHFDTTVNELDDPAYINTYVMANLTGAGGYGFYPGYKSRIMLAILTPELVAHELGHAMGLVHTFGNGFNGTDELVNGSNCQTAGDRICDTPADPYPLGVYPGTNCLYEDTVLTDLNGQLYNPLTDNIMSYNQAHCQNAMTAGQGQFMNSIEATERFYYASDTSGLRIYSFPGTICVGDSTNYNLASEPAGGVFTGPGITNNVLNASNLSAGSYSATLSLGGNTADSALITDAAQIATGWPLDTAYLWQSYKAKRGGIVEEVQFRFSNAMAETIQLKVYNGTGTGGSLILTESFSVPADSNSRWVSFPLSNPYTQTAGQLFTLELTAQNGNIMANQIYTDVLFGGVSNVQEPSSIPSGFWDYSWTFLVTCLTNEHQCSNSITFDFQVTEPWLWYGIPQELETKHCVDGPPSDLRGFGYYSFDSIFVSGQLTDTIFPNQLTPGDHNVRYKVEDFYGCWHALDTTITIFGYPDLGIDSLACISDSSVDFAAIHPEGTFWINGVQDSVFVPSTLGPGTHLVDAHIPNLFDTAHAEFETLGWGEDNFFKAVGLNDTIGQSFVSDTSGFLHEITILTVIGANFQYFGYPIPVSIELRKGTNPNGQLLHSDVLSLPDTFAYIDFIDGDYTMIPVEKDSTYTMYVHRLDTGMFNNVRLRGENTGLLYTNGDLFENGTFSTNADLDLALEVWHEMHCGEEQSIEVVISDDVPLVDLGGDQSDCDSIILSGGLGPNYEWSNGSTAASITVFNSGLYWLEVSNGCKASDSALVTIHPPALLNDIVGDSVLVAGTPYAFSVVPTNGSTYQWSTISGQILSGQGTANASILWSAPALDLLQVEETTDEGCTSESIAMNVTIEEPIGIASVLNAPIRVYPNPASGSVTLNLKPEEVIGVTILDANGRTVLQSSGQSNINVSHLANGLYLLQVSARNQSTSLRLVVQH